MYDLPIMAKNEYTKREIGVVLGRVEEVGIDEGEVEWGEFMRIRASIKDSKPLLRWKRLNIGLSKLVWVRFEYERLPDICFSCGVLGHGHKECPKWEKWKQQCEIEGFPYGS